MVTTTNHHHPQQQRFILFLSLPPSPYPPLFLSISFSLSLPLLSFSPQITALPLSLTSSEEKHYSTQVKINCLRDKKTAHNVDSAADKALNLWFVRLW